MTEDQMREFLDENSDRIKTAVRDKMISSLVENYQWNIHAEIANTVNEFVKDEIVPEVKAHLQSEKGAIVEAAIKGCAEIGDTIAKGMVETAMKNVGGGSYRFNAVMKELFA